MSEALRTCPVCGAEVGRPDTAVGLYEEVAVTCRRCGIRGEGAFLGEGGLRRDRLDRAIEAAVASWNALPRADSKSKAVLGKLWDLAWGGNAIRIEAIPRVNPIEISFEEMSAAWEEVEPPDGE